MSYSPHIITPPEPTLREILDDIDERSKKYLNAKEDLKNALEEIETYKKEIEEAKEYLWAEHNIKEEDIERIDFDECT